MAAKFEILQPKSGEYRWVLTSQGRVLARSEAYTRRVSCVKAMEAFRQAAPTAEILDTTAQPAATRGRAKAAPAPASTTAKLARTTGRAMGKAAATVTEAPSLVVEAAKKVVETVKPTPRRRPAGTG